MYLGGDVAFRLVMGIRPVAFRAGAAVAALGSVALGIGVAAAVQLIGLVLIILGALAAEAKWGRVGVALHPQVRRQAAGFIRKGARLWIWKNPP